MYTLASHADISKSYNQLDDVSIADDQLTALGRRDCLDSLMAVITKFKLEQIVGVRLMHKHNVINSHEVMVEEEFFDDQGFGLATYPAKSIHPPRYFAVNSWQLTQDGFVPCEFSNASLLTNGGINPAEFNEFFEEFKQVLIDKGVQDILGPCVHYSDVVEEHCSDSNTILLETTNYAERTNVLRFESMEKVQTMLTRETKWAASQSNSNDPKSTAKCKCVCSVAPEGGHLGTHTHLR